MPILSSPSGAFPTSLIYITVGTLMDVWTILALVYYPPESQWGHFLLVGFLTTGAALLIIGLLLGPIGRFARNAELPPTQVTAAVAQAEQTAAAHPPAVIAGNAIQSPTTDGPGAPGAIVPVVGTQPRQSSQLGT